MSEEWKPVFEQLKGKRVLIERRENGEIYSTVVLKITTVTNGIVEGMTDKGVRQWLLLSTIQKVKEVSDFRR